MTVNKRKKKSRLRGSHTHGWGSKKKHRGAGNRGGRGMAGSGKRSDQKKPSIINEYGNSYFGKRGFRRKNIIRRISTINIKDLNNYKDSVNLKELGFDKLLGKGNINKKLVVTINSASKKAVEKIEKAGGKVIKDGVNKPNNS